MVKRLGLMVMPFLFLIIGISAITFIFVPITNTFSLMNENQNSNTYKSITIIRYYKLYTIETAGSLYSFSTFE